MAETRGTNAPTNSSWFDGKRVMVVGLARSGYAAVRLLKSLHALPIVTDSKTGEQLAKTLVEHGKPDCPCFFGVDPLLLLHAVSAVVVSPAVPIDSPLAKRALAMDIPVISELELVYLV
ncbi:MAG: hypothetical protein GX810_06630, partial [Clostridiales bacterium]|nr:hypothetical protein [Clostridiales bacterium]